MVLTWRSIGTLFGNVNKVKLLAHIVQSHLSVQVIVHVVEDDHRNCDDLSPLHRVGQIQGHKEGLEDLQLTWSLGHSEATEGVHSEGGDYP